MGHENTEGQETQPQKGELIIIDPAKCSNRDDLVLTELGPNLFDVKRRVSQATSGRASLAEHVDRVLRIGGDK